MNTNSSTWQQKTLVVLGSLLGLLFTAAGTTKLLGLPWQVENFARWGFPNWFMYVTGAVEVVGGLLLLVPRTRAFGVALMLPTMICAVLTHIQAGEAPRAIPATVFLVVLSLIAIQMRRARSAVAAGPTAG